MNRHLLMGCILLLAGCAELYRWPDRMNQRPAKQNYEPAAEGYYVVKPSDTLYSIAFRHQLDFRELAVWNDIGPDYLIRPSQLLRLTPPPIRADRGSSIQTRPMQPVRDTPAPPIVTPTMPPMPAAYGWQWPTAGTLVKSFGEDNGKGVDIAGAMGQSVIAAAPGKVVYSGSALKGYGELIIIKHDETRLSAYGYNRRRLVEEGVVVAAGQPIAELGLGPEQKPVLHFEIREKGKPVDPLKLLPRR